GVPSPRPVEIRQGVEALSRVGMFLAQCLLSDFERALQVRLGFDILSGLIQTQTEPVHKTGVIFSQRDSFLKLLYRITVPALFVERSTQEEAHVRIFSDSLLSRLFPQLERLREEFGGFRVILLIQSRQPLLVWILGLFAPLADGRVYRFRRQAHDFRLWLEHKPSLLIGDLLVELWNHFLQHSGD